MSGQPFDFSAMATLPKTAPEPDLPYEATEDFRQVMTTERRARLIRHVEHGEISPKRAEALALADKLGPLRKPPADSFIFDASMAFWTLEMTATWIVTRDPRAVLRHHAPSYEGVSVWKTNSHRFLVNSKRKQHVWDERTKATHRSGHDLIKLGPTDYSRGYYDFDGKPQTFPDIKAIYPELQAHLSCGNIVAYGLPKALHSTPCHLDRSLWQYATLSIRENGDAEVEFNGKRFWHLQFNAAGILEMYEPKSPLVMQPRDVRPWIRPTPKLEAYQVPLVDRLQRLYPVGIPIFRSEKVRDAELIRCLGEDGVTRWFGRKPDQKDNDLDRAHEKFRMAMRRLIDKVCAKETIVQSQLPRPVTSAERE